MQPTLMSHSTSVHAASAAPRVKIEIADPSLAAELRQALSLGRETEGDELPALTVTDTGTVGRAVAIVTAAGQRTIVADGDPALILAAVALLRAGYSIRREPIADDHLPPTVRLSPREQQVAALLLEGASNKAIARALEISVHTAKFHVTAVLDKLAARNRADAVSIILREGLIAL
jgi:DNA-binding NarL/FixJ family response regulator